MPTPCGDYSARRHLGELLAVAAAHVRLGAQSLNHVRVVQLECRALRTDAGQLSEVVPRRRATGGPLQRVAVSPWVVDGDYFAVAPALEDVPENRNNQRPQEKRPDRRDD